MSCRTFYKMIWIEAKAMCLSSRKMQQSWRGMRGANRACARKMIHDDLLWWHKMIAENQRRVSFKWPLASLWCKFFQFWLLLLSTSIYGLLCKYICVEREKTCTHFYFSETRDHSAHTLHNQIFFQLTPHSLNILLKYHFPIPQEAFCNLFNHYKIVFNFILNVVAMNILITKCLPKTINSLW